jgi:hypothetical protein
MEALAADCFGTMWANTEQLALAGHDIRAPSKPLAILILALHALRSPDLPPCREELDFLTALTREEALASEILELSESTGSLAAMRPFLGDLLPTSSVPVWPEASLEWRNRLLAQEPGSARIIALVQSPWHEKPQMLWRAVFPGRQVLLSRDVHADMSPQGLASQHAARWGRFLRAIPKIASDLKRYGG